MRPIKIACGLILALGLAGCGDSVAVSEDASSLTTDFGSAVVTSKALPNGDILSILQDAERIKVLGQLHYSAQTGQYQLDFADIDAGRLDRNVAEAVAPTLEETNELLYNVWVMSTDEQPYWSMRCVGGLCACASGCYRRLYRTGGHYVCCCWVTSFVTQR